MYIYKLKKMNIFFLLFHFLKITTFNYRKIYVGSDKLKHVSETFTAVDGA